MHIGCVWALSILNELKEFMKSIQTLFMLAACLTTIPCGAAGKPINILCLGDSITQGGHAHRIEYTYRWPLFCMLTDAGVEFDFIGSLDGGIDKEATWPASYGGQPFDLDHEGVYGIKTGDALARLPEASKAWDGVPDIALIHLGSNDKKFNKPEADVKEPLRKIVEFLREKNPDIVVFLAHLDYSDDPGAFRVMAEISELRKEMDTEQSPVRVVHHFQNWNENPDAPNADTFDWSHPNPAGQKKMAKKWFDAMQPWLK